MNQKKAYSYDFETGIFNGETVADESPLEPGIFHIPANSTMEKPPVPGAGQKVIYQNGAWLIVNIPAPPEPPVPTAAEIIAAENAAAKAALSKLDMESIRSMREWIAAQPSAPKILKDKDAAAAVERGKLK